MSASELNEHLQYWADDVKIDRYRRALAEVVEPGDSVLDLGTGTGLLGLLACEVGAGHVYAVDNGPIASAAADVFAQNGIADRVEVIRSRSTAVTVEPVEVIVGDQIGGFAFSAGVLRYYADATARLLRPGGKVVPSRFELFLAPVEHEASRDAIDGFVRHASGFDLAPLHRLASNSIRPVHLEASALLGDPVAVHERASDDASRLQLRARLPVLRDGRLDGVAGFFRAHMSPSVRMSNLPGDADAMRHRWQDLFPVTEGLSVTAGEVVEIELSVNPISYLTAWSIAIDRGSGSEGAEHHSSFEGELFDLQRFHTLTGRPYTSTAIGRAAAAAVAAADDVLDVRSLVSEVVDALPDAPPEEVDRVVRAVVAAAGRP